ncbi:MAG: thioredoxin-related protein [Paraglaciecola sp.]|jgi:thioredoxin-related protein
MKISTYFLTLIYLLIAVGCASSSRKLDAAPTAFLEQYQFAELDSLMQQEQRPLAIFLHAPWCKFCKNMKQTTLQNKAVISILNENYYFISFDGEQKEPVFFQNHLFKYQPKGRTTGTHELANALGSLNGILAYPTFVILNSDYEIVFQHNAFLNSQEMEKLLETGLKN